MWFKKRSLPKGRSSKRLRVRSKKRPRFYVPRNLSDSEVYDVLQAISSPANNVAIPSDSTDDLTNEIYRLLDNCHLKRIRLEAISSRNAKLSKKLSFISSFLSLLSAATLASIVTELLSSRILSVAALCFAFGGGVFAILGSMRFNVREIVNLHLGATKFLALREAATVLMDNKELQDKTKRSRLEELTKRYCNLSEMMDHYITI